MGIITYTLRAVTRGELKSCL